MFSDALDKLAAYAGGAENLQDVFLDAIRSNGSAESKITFLNTVGRKPPCSNGGYACWDGRSATILLSDYIFTSEYQEVRQQQKKVGLGIQETISHEVVHAFVDGHPWIVDFFVGSIDDPTPFYPALPNCIDSCLYKENIASLIARYVVTGKTTSMDQLYFILNAQDYWQAQDYLRAWR